MYSAFLGENELQVEENRAPWNPIINDGDEQRDRFDQEAGKRRYDSRRKLMREHFERDGSRMSALQFRLLWTFDMADL